VVVEVACEPDLMEEGSTWFDAAEIGENDRERIDLNKPRNSSIFPIAFDVSRTQRCVATRRESCGRLT
jgi:hypothetical protein